MDERVQMFAAVGADGTRPVVWGLGTTEEEARMCAERWLSEANREIDDEPLTYHAITTEQAEAIEAGDVSWPVTSERGTV